MSSPEPTTLTFAELGLDPRLLPELTALGYSAPTPIQEVAIPLVLAAHDLLGQAATGTGKTAAFSLPMLQRLAAMPRTDARPRAMVLVPTRELAVQVHKTMQRHAAALGLKIIEIYGGAPFGRQIRALEMGVDVVIATPGRAIDLQDRGNLVLDAVEIVVLDEADEMLNMGFAEDIETLLGFCRQPRQTLLFSATFPPRLKSIAGRHLNNPKRVDVTRGPQATPTAATVEHVAYIVPRQQKIQALGRILEWTQPSGALVFCRSRDDVDELCEKLSAKGVRAEALHGGLSQDQRDRVMSRFRRGACELLVATDVAARGLDVDQLSHVINYDLPVNGEIYVHRSGRTGRAGREGCAITLLEPMQQRMVKSMERVVGRAIKVAKIPSTDELRARRLQTTVHEISEALAEDTPTEVSAALRELLASADPVALLHAAFRVAHRASGRETERFADAPTRAGLVAQPSVKPALVAPLPKLATIEAATATPTATLTAPSKHPSIAKVAGADPVVAAEQHGFAKAPSVPPVLAPEHPTLAEQAVPVNHSDTAQVAALPAAALPLTAKEAKKAARKAARAAARGEATEVVPPPAALAPVQPPSAPATSTARPIGPLVEPRRERRVTSRVPAPLHFDDPREARPTPAHGSFVPSERKRAAHRTFDERASAQVAFTSRPATTLGGGFTPRRKNTRHETTHLHFDVGAVAGVKPSDLVGAIANETGLDSKAIGAIRIEERSSWVEIPADFADAVVDALRRTSIRGTRTKVRRVT